MDDQWASGDNLDSDPPPAGLAHPAGFSIHEAMPYSPHSSVIPFIPDYLPEPTIGSGPISKRLTGSYDSSKFDALNKDVAPTPGELPRSVRHAADAILHDLKAGMKTAYKFKESPLCLPVTKPTESLAANLTPVSKAVYDAVGSIFVKKGSVCPSPATSSGAAPSNSKNPPHRQGTAGSMQRVRTNSTGSRSSGILADVSPAQAQVQGWRSPKQTPHKTPNTSYTPVLPPQRGQPLAIQNPNIPPQDGQPQIRTAVPVPVPTPIHNAVVPALSPAAAAYAAKVHGPSQAASRTPIPAPMRPLVRKPSLISVKTPTRTPVPVPKAASRAIAPTEAHPPARTPVPTPVRAQAALALPAPPTAPAAFASPISPVKAPTPAATPAKKKRKKNVAATPVKAEADDATAKPSPLNGTLARQVPVAETPAKKLAPVGTPSKKFAPMDTPAKKPAPVDTPAKKPVSVDTPIKKSPITETTVKTSPAAETPAKPARLMPIETKVEPVPDYPAKQIAVDSAPARAAPIEDAPITAAPAQDTPSMTVPPVSTPIKPNVPATPAKVHSTSAVETSSQPRDKVAGAQPRQQPHIVVETTLSLAVSQPSTPVVPIMTQPRPHTTTPQPQLVTPTPSQSEGLAVPMKLPRPSPSRQYIFKLEIPALNINPDEYIEVDDTIVDLPTNLSSRKRKRDDATNSQGMLSSNLDHRQRVAVSLQDLSGFTVEIFLALENPSTDGNSPVALTDDSQPILTPAAHQKLQLLISKTIDIGSYQSVRLKDLLQFLKLSENSLKNSDVSLRLSETWGEEDVGAWVRSLGDLEHALKAARTALRIMSGGREDKQLYSEDVIQHCVRLIKDVLFGVIVPVVELRTYSPLFKLLTPHKKAITTFMTVAQRSYTLLSMLVAKIRFSDMVLSTLSYDACRVTFVDNALVEKESVMGIAKFDGIRLIAMDVICCIFLIRPDERRGIFTDILTSLEKLPIGRQGAKQFKINDGGSIQPVSALIMRLAHASSGKVPPRIELDRTAGIDDEDGGAESEDPLAADAPKTKKRKTDKSDKLLKSEEAAAANYKTAFSELRAAAAEPMATALANINHVITFVTDRALKATKSGESPYRNLLDQFVDDFTLCLGSPDWPVAELILRQLMMLMTRTFENEKSSAPAKNTALEILGNLCAAISTNRFLVRKAAVTLGASHSDQMSQFLAELSHSMLDNTARPDQILDWQGPYRATLEYLQGRVSDDPHLSSAMTFLVADWADQTLAAVDTLQEPNEHLEKYGQLAWRLRMMIEDPAWLSNEYSFMEVPATHAKVAYINVLLQSRLFSSFAGILNVLLRSMASDQATVRSRSLKSINQVIETDPSILDGDSLVVRLILQCSSDTSTQVRDSALGLIGKCIAYRQRLELKMLPTVLERFLDQGIGVRKRAMKLARDIYLRNTGRAVRSEIANSLLLRVQDPDEGVQDLARQMIEEIWFTPFYALDKDAAYKIAVKEHVALIIHTVKSGNVGSILDKIFESILDPEPKPTAPPTNGTSSTAAAAAAAQTHNPSAVCAQFVEAMFDFINNMDGEDATVPSGKDALSVLHTFAKTDPSLFTYDQINVLKPYLTLSPKPPTEELLVFRSVALIYRRVLPNFSAAMHKEFLTEVRTRFLSAVGKVAKGLLDEVIACIWIISDHLKSLFSLVRMSCSSIGNMKKFHKQPLDRLDRGVLERIKMYMVIVGFVGKHARLEGEFETFKKAAELAPFPPRCDTVSRLMLHHLLPFTGASVPRDLRQAALEAMGLICESNPRNYVLPFVYTALQGAFDDRDPGLEDVVMRSFKEFFLAEELRSGTSKKGGAKAKADKRQLLVMGGTNYDDVASATTQRFLESITRIALATQDEHAYLALELIGSINRQGLVHPKETGVTLITLETSQHRGISELACAEHRVLHEKHESTIEREYAKAMQSAYNYQRDVVKETRGATTNPFQAKLHLWLDVLKISKSKNRQRFFDKLCSQLDFDPSEMDAAAGDEGALPPAVDYCRFVIENITYIEYATVGEVMATVAALEKLVATIGTGLAHILESELLNLNLDALNAPASAAEGGDTTSAGEAVPPQQVLKAANVDPSRLRQLTASSMILHAVWESRTHLRRLYSLGLNKRDQKAKAMAKDLAKAPVKVQGVHGDKIWEELATIMSSLQSEQLMVARCKSFAELMRVDKDFKIADEGDGEDDDEGAGTPTDDEDEDEDDGPMTAAGPSTPEPSGRGRKRRAPAAAPKSRKKQALSGSQPPRRRGRPPKNAQTPPKGSDDDGWN